MGFTFILILSFSLLPYIFAPLYILYYLPCLVTSEAALTSLILKMSAE